jgi:hypothetical protein
LTKALPIACSLDADGLELRLAEIAATGKESLIGHETEKGRHLLHFRSDAATRKRLEKLVAAEAQCCSFLDLTLEERGSDLILSVASPPDGQAVADELVATFAAGLTRGRARLRLIT